MLVLTTLYPRPPPHRNQGSVHSQQQGLAPQPQLPLGPPSHHPVELATPRKFRYQNAFFLSWKPQLAPVPQTLEKGAMPILLPRLRPAFGTGEGGGCYQTHLSQLLWCGFSPGSCSILVPDSFISCHLSDLGRGLRGSGQEPCSRGLREQEQGFLRRGMSSAPVSFPEHFLFWSAQQELDVRYG